MNAKLLKSIMVLNDDTIDSLADYLGISPRSCSDKINERGTEFKQSEIAKIRIRYNLDDNQTTAVFFA